MLLTRIGSLTVAFTLDLLLLHDQTLQSYPQETSKGLIVQNVLSEHLTIQG